MVLVIVVPCSMDGKGRRARSPARPGPEQPSPRPCSPRPAAGGAGGAWPPAWPAWVDYGGQLHVGDLATGAQRVVATVGASPADPMIVAAGRLYWVGAGDNAAPIGSYDIATGMIRNLAHGNSVVAPAHGRHLYITQTGTRLIELPPGGIGAPRQLVLPAGWH